MAGEQWSGIGVPNYWDKQEMIGKRSAQGQCRGFSDNDEGDPVDPVCDSLNLGFCLYSSITTS